MSNEIRVVTNNQPRDIVDACELTPAERAEFDYLDWPAIDDGRDSASFVRYRGQLLDLGNLMRFDSPDSMPGWDGYYGTSYFSAYVVRYVNDNEQVVIGEVLS